MIAGRTVHCFVGAGKLYRNSIAGAASRHNEHE
jgi:hypothetical protein